MSLTNPNTPVSQQDLKDLYEQKILPYIGGAFGLVATGIDSANLYSTTERVIGQWIDGKPLYQKTVDCGALPNAGQSSVSHNIANIDIIPNFWGVGINQSGTSLKIPGEVTGSNHASAVGCYVNRTEIGFLTYNDRSEYHAYVTIQYTKTTDSAVESYGTDTTYSTDEHVVGSWIDGSPLYQKSFKIVPANYGGSSSLVLPSSLTGLTNFLTISHEIWDIYSECYNMGVSSTRISDNAILINGLNLNYPNIDHWITIRYKKLVSS